jgi:hypothetical protein
MLLKQRRQSTIGKGSRVDKRAGKQNGQVDTAGEGEGIVSWASDSFEAPGINYQFICFKSNFRAYLYSVKKHQNQDRTYDATLM